MNCTRCDQTGFLNLEQMNGLADNMEPDEILEWMKANESDVQVCDCCGNIESWYGEPGRHTKVEGKWDSGNVECW